MITAKEAKFEVDKLVEVNQELLRNELSSVINIAYDYVKGCISTAIQSRLYSTYISEKELHIIFNNVSYEKALYFNNNIIFVMKELARKLDLLGYTTNVIRWDEYHMSSVLYIDWSQQW